MTVRISKPEFNLREKLSELDRPTGFKGLELMRSDTAQDARDLISAGRRNLIINGSMAVAQRGTSVSAQSFSSPVTPVCDRWQFRSSNLDQANFDISQQTDAPKGVCTKSIKVDVNAAETELAANESFWIAQTIEGRNCSDLGFGDLNASDLTISFYVKSNVIGKYTVYLYTQDPNRYITRTYTIDTAGNWERKIIHIPGDTDGNAINHDNGIGLKIYWYLLSGSDYKSADSSQAWASHSSNGTAFGHEVNIATSTSNYWQLTGVQVERGSNATEFENRSFGEEFALCQRYFVRMNGSTGGLSTNDGALATLANWTDTAAYGPIFMPVEMRTPPALATYSNLKYYSAGQTFTPTGSQAVFTGAANDRVEIRLNSMTSMSQGNAGWLRVDNTNGYMDFNSEY